MKRVLLVAVALPVMIAGLLAAAESRSAGSQTAAAPSKMTICHRTDSESNPWRRITISSRAWANPKSQSGRTLRAHMRHVGDAIVTGTPACPPATQTPAPTNTPPTRMTICHKTGSISTPYRRITISSRAAMNPNSQSGRTARAHARHNGDILFPGVTPCPAGTPPQPVRLTANLQPVAGATGSGTAGVTIRLGLGQLCYSVTVTGLTNVTAAHIHRVAGGTVVVPFSPPTTGTASGCTTVEKALLQEIVRDPGAFFVNVHTTEKPDGHVQGLLTR